ncbi:YihY/virulence factor BrkB family protein [Williamsia sp. 1135]|uniref:YihY/virulence factor BrkB family protein n=1 Tax=Williamsia sp. 1135 TaxID=1889262 RepID=UPI001F0B37CF|nr:YihY/virulence factor BrkB family protein [Williamsia sp. 1135]
MFRNAGVITQPTEPSPDPATPHPSQVDDTRRQEGAGDRPRVLKSLPWMLWRTITKSWDDSIFAMSAQAAFWQTLSLPPLLLGLLGCVGYVANWFGPNTEEIIQDRIISFAERTFSQNVVDEIITPTVDNVLVSGRAEVISLGFVLSLWAGSSAMSSFVDSIVVAHGQHNVRHAVTQRLFALWLYVCFLVLAVLTLPLVALGPAYVREVIPDSWHPASSVAIEYGYFPAVALLLLAGLTTLYRVALAKPLPWHRLVPGALLAGLVFWCASAILRWYLATITQTGYSYGALATPIAFLLFTFFLGFAIVVGAEFNAIAQQLWPANPTKIDQVRDWVSQQTSDITDQLKGVPAWLPSGPIKRSEASSTTPAPAPREKDAPSTGPDAPR